MRVLCRRDKILGEFHFPGRAWLGVLLATAIATGGGLMGAATATATVGWSVHSFVSPSLFSSNDEIACLDPLTGGRCDRYQLVVRNVGDTPSTGSIEVTDRLPAGITTTGEPERSHEVRGEEWECTEPATGTEKVNVVKCVYPLEVRPEGVTPALSIPTTAPSAISPSEQHGECLLKGNKEAPEKCVEKNEIEVTGGGAAGTATTTNETPVSSEAQPFELTSATLEADAVGGGQDTLAGGHPGDVTSSLEFSNIFQPQPPISQNNQAEPVENPRAVIVELPAGFVGDPQATPTKCPENDLVRGYFGSEEVKTACPPESRVGVISVDLEGSMLGTTANSGEEAGPTSIYNMTPQAGYPAVFAFQVGEKPVYMYPTLVHTPSGYRLRVSAPGIVAALDVVGTSITFFGDPEAEDGAAGPHTAFLTNPADCSDGPLSTKIEADSWENPGRWVAKEVTTYPQITGCNLLQFEPTLEMAPGPSTGEGTSQADEPSAYDVDLKVPQKSLFEESATPDLKDATVTLPAGVSISPSVADGLGVCQEHGPEGIDIPESRSGHEAGEGETIGPDGLPHMTPGHCPAASTLGTVQITTPLLPAPVTGHVFLAAPKCGGASQPACTEASATNGELYGLYIEAEDRAAGVIVKIPGIVEADPVTGRLTGRFKENPQLPFSEVKLHFSGGPRAELANPQTCGSFATTSTLTSWAGQEVPGTSPSFPIDWDGHGGACPATLPFAPGFEAGTINSPAGAFSPFVLSFSRNDREQDLAGLSVTLPPGLLAKIAGIPLCGEEQANAGTCGPASQLGVAGALAGPGPNPFYVSGGRVYLTTGYKNQPFGLSIVVPAVAGPFNLGNVVVRASIAINKETGQVTVTSDSLPQSRDGVPFRLRKVVTEINRPGFTFNPTNCSAQQITGTITGAQNAKAAVSSPFAATGCAGLPFGPSLTASTQGAAGPKGGGASLVVKVAQKAGEANIHKVSLTLPKALPARLTTLQKACTEAQFNTNPAGCPEASNIGTATAITPILDAPVTGPAYLVSHGGAAFPDVEFVLQGEGVKIVLDGKTDIKNGITYSKFETVPDAPISSFETTLPEGQHSALASPSGSLCGQNLVMPTTITGQNGAVKTQNTKIAVTGCGKPKLKLAKVKVKGANVLVTVTTTQQGVVTVSGAGLKTTKKTLGAGKHQLKVALTKNGRAARRHGRKTKLKVVVRNDAGAASGAVTFRL